MQPRPVEHRPRQGLTAALAAFLFVSAQALPGSAAAASAASDAAAAPIILAAGDVLKIVVFNRPELSGNYPVGPDGTIRVPLAGPIKVSGADMATVERTLTDRVSQLLDYDVPVTVDMAQYRPVFVIGAVAEPGEHDYTPGLRVMQAVARAGGLSLGQAPTAATAIDVLRARRKLMAAQLEVQRLSVRLAALDHLLDNTETLMLPEDLGDAANTPFLQDVLRDQRSLAESRRESLRDIRVFTERQQSQLDEEISALLSEKKALTSQAALVRQEVRSIQSLHKQGLTTNARVLSQRQMDTDIKADLYRLTAYLSRVRQKKVELEQRLETAEDEWRAEHLRERVQIAADLAQATADLEAARAEALALGIAQLEGPVEAVTAQDAHFVISRPGADGLMSFDADAAAALRPGDILHVGLPSMTRVPKGDGKHRETTVDPEPARTGPASAQKATLGPQE